MEAVFSATAAGTDSGATATAAADAQKSYVVTCISGHGDADTILTVKSGTTIVWESKLDVSVEGFSFHFPGLYLAVPNNTATTGNIVSSSADCQVTISGYSI